MILVVLFALTLVTVPLTGGRLSRLGDLRLQRGWLLAASLGSQIFIINVWPQGPEALLTGIHLGSYALAGLFVWCNRSVPGLWVIALGGLLNLLAIGANGGVMPASQSAMEAAGIEVEATQFENSQVLADPELAPLGDVFAIPEPLPLANVFSVGDVVLLVGAAWAGHRIGRSRLGRLVERGGERVDAASAPQGADATAGAA